MRRRFPALLAGLALLAAGARAQTGSPGAGGASPRSLRVAVYDARGVGRSALDTALAAYRAAPGIVARTVSPADVRAGALDGADVVLFTGGRGSVQGRLLREEGRDAVRAFVRRGGGYVGICAGFYLAIQGPPEFHKLAMVAAVSLRGDAWRRGIRPSRVRPTDGAGEVTLHYANGPVVARRPTRGLRPFVTLATFASDIYWERYDTHPREMPGTPAIAAARYGRGRLLLFSPNPSLGEGEEAHPELLVRATRWVGRGGGVPRRLRYRDVFGAGG